MFSARDRFSLQLISDNLNVVALLLSMIIESGPQSKRAFIVTVYFLFKILKGITCKRAFSRCLISLLTVLISVSKKLDYLWYVLLYSLQLTIDLQSPKWWSLDKQFLHRLFLRTLSICSFMLIFLRSPHYIKRWLL